MLSESGEWLDLFRPGAHFGLWICVMILLFIGFKRCDAQIEDPDFGRFDPIGYTGASRLDFFREVAQVSRANVNGSQIANLDTVPDVSYKTLELRDTSQPVFGGGIIFVENEREIDVSLRIFIVGDNELDSIKREAFIEGYKSHAKQSRRTVPSWIMWNADEAWKFYQLAKEE